MVNVTAYAAMSGGSKCICFEFILRNPLFIPLKTQRNPKNVSLNLSQEQPGLTCTLWSTPTHVKKLQIFRLKNVREKFKQIKSYSESYIKAYIEQILGPFTQMLEAKFS